MDSGHHIRLTIDSAQLEGQAENISRGGVLFFTDESLSVVVEIEEEGVVRRANGRLVRMQQMRGDSTGWAVEFTD